MADPVTIVQVVSAATGLVGQCASVAKSLHDIAGKYKNARLTLSSMIQELDTIEMAWSRITEWSRDYSDELLANDRLPERLANSLECGTLVMSALQADFASFKTNTKTLGFRQRSRLVWNENLLRDHQDRIRGQATSMTLLLQVLKLYVLPMSSQ